MKPGDSMPRLFAGLAWAVLATTSAAGSAQDYPTRPVRMIIPFPPGGSNDIVGRMVGTRLGERLGRPVVIDNRGGAGGLIGTELAVKSQPDGHTLLVISVAYAYNPFMYKLSFDPVKAIVTVAQLGTGPNAFAVHPALPAKSVKEVIALAKAKPGQLRYASAGVGTFQHLSSELFRLMAGVDMVHVPFKGGGPAMVSVISGETQISIGSLIQTLPHIRSGRLRALGIGGTKRSPVLPDVPTIAESGLPGYEANNWWGIVAPAGTPPGIVKRLHGEITGILTAPDVQKWFASEGAESVNRTPEEFASIITSEMGKWGKVVKQAGIRGE